MFIYLGFLEKWTIWIMKCMATVSLLVLVNGILGNPFRSERGVRQRVPISTYIFIICAESFGGYIHLWLIPQNLELVYSSQKIPMIPSLMITNDYMVFCKANKCGKIC